MPVSFLGIRGYSDSLYIGWWEKTDRPKPRLGRDRTFLSEMTTIPELQTKLQWANKRVAFAWAKYYEQVNNALHDDWIHYNDYNRVADDRSIPEHIKVELKEMAKALQKKWECPVCMDFIADGVLDITNCGHYYCKPCLEAWKKAEKDNGKDKWSCGMCNRKHKFNE
jgi:hypothetical protein